MVNGLWGDKKHTDCTIVLFFEDNEVRIYYIYIFFCQSYAVNKLGQISAHRALKNNSIFKSFRFLSSRRVLRFCKI